MRVKRDGVAFPTCQKSAKKRKLHILQLRRNEGDGAGGRDKKLFLFIFLSLSQNAAKSLLLRNALLFVGKL